MASIIKIKRSSVQGKSPNTSVISSGELALNTRDGKLFSSDGSSVFEIGANLHSLSVGTGGFSIANGAITFPTSDGSAGQVLKTDGSGNLSFSDDAGGATDSLGYTNSTITGPTIVSLATYDAGLVSDGETSDAFGVIITGEVLDCMEPVREVVSADCGALT